MENFRYDNVFDCRAAADDLGFSARTWLCDGMAETAARFGRQWRTSGAAEAGSDYDKRYEKLCGGGGSFAGKADGTTGAGSVCG